MYGNYGRPQDLDVLQDKNVSLRDSVLLLRAGQISFAEQVTAGVDASLCLEAYFVFLGETPLKACLSCVRWRLFRWTTLLRREPPPC